jgi:hypothetical protein
MTTATAWTIGEKEAEVLAVFFDMNETDELAEYLLHCGIDGEAIEEAGDVIPAILEHYRVKGGYDIDMVARDLARWPPIAKRIRELKREHKQAKAEQRAAKDRERKRKAKRANGAELRNCRMISTKAA